MLKNPRLALNLFLAACAIALLAARAASADNAAQGLTFTQNWSDTSLIITDDNWASVAGVIGFRGDGLTSSTDVDPQTVLGDETTIDVNANRTNPNTFTTGGVAEFHLTDPVVALQGSGTADAPFIVLYLNTSGKSNITIAYNLRDIDGSTDNAVQQVALQYRIGSTGNFTNVPAGYVADATTGPSLATLVTPVSATLPAAADNQLLVQVRIITTNASGNDEWVGIDDLQVSGTAPSLSISDVSVTEGDSGVTTAVFTASLSAPAGPGGVTFDIATQDNTATAAGGDYVTKSLVGQTIAAGSSTYLFNVTINGDTSGEPDESFFVNVTNISGATAADTQGVGTIENDDEAVASLSAINSGPTLLGQATLFTATISAGSNVAYQWNFGDGQMASGAVAAHTYAAVGAFTTVVTASNSINAMTTTTTVNVTDVPVSALSASSSPAILGHTTFFTASVGTGSNVAYQWDFGDGQIGAGSTVTHTYAAMGMHTAVVTANNSINTITAMTAVSVTDEPISALSATSSPATLGQTTFFTANVGAGSNVAYQWDFGDGFTGVGNPISHTYVVSGTFAAVITATNSAGSLSATTQAVVFAPPTYHAFLALMTHNYVNAPDLVIHSVSVTGDSVQVVIQNRGTARVNDEFWVDLYVDPDPVPTGVNQIWNDGRSAQGVVWGVTATAFPSLQPGGVLTLTLGDAYYWPSLSNFSGSLPPGTPIYAQVDSANVSTSYGAVLENHEITGEAYNNIGGPVTSIAAARGEPTQAKQYVSPARAAGVLKSNVTTVIPRRGKR